MAPSVFRLTKILLISFHRVQSAVTGPSGACGGRGEERWQKLPGTNLMQAAPHAWSFHLSEHLLNS